MLQLCGILTAATFGAASAASAAAAAAAAAAVASGAAVVSVADFGAVPDRGGVRSADSCEAFGKAVDQVRASGAGTLRIPRGVYHFHWDTCAAVSIYVSNTVVTSG